MAYRSVEYRLIVGNKDIGESLQEICDKGKDFYNYLIDDNKTRYQQWENGQGNKPSIYRQDTQKLVTRVKAGNYFNNCPSVTLRAVCRDFERAWKGKFRNPKSNKGFPNYKEESNSFTIDIYPNVRHSKKVSTVKIPRIDGRLVIRRKGSDKYKTVGLGKDTNIKEITVKRGIGNKWYIVLLYKVKDEPVINDEIVGVDFNCDNICTSEGDMYVYPDVKKEITNIKNKQKKLSRKVGGSNRHTKIKNQIAKAHRKKANRIKNFHHKVSNKLREFDVVLEDLDIKKMVSKENRNSCADLRRRMTQAGWALLQWFLLYKTNVVYVNPAYTSQTCYSCKEVRKANRKSQQRYLCSSCGVDVNADLNAAMNIGARGIGVTEHGRFNKIMPKSVNTINLETCNV